MYIVHIINICMLYYKRQHYKLYRMFLKLSLNVCILMCAFVIYFLDMRKCIFLEMTYLISYKIA